MSYYVAELYFFRYFNEMKRTGIKTANWNTVVGIDKKQHGI